MISQLTAPSGSLISPLYLLYISPISPLYLPCISPVSPLYLPYKAAASLLLGMGIFMLRLGLKELSATLERDQVTSFKVRVRAMFGIG